MSLPKSIDNYLLSIGTNGKKASLRYAAGLLGVSYETLRGWQTDHVPALDFLHERKGHVVETYNLLNEMIQAVTPSSADLVVAERVE